MEIKIQDKYVKEFALVLFRAQVDANAIHSILNDYFAQYNGSQLQAKPYHIYDYLIKVSPASIISIDNGAAFALTLRYLSIAQVFTEVITNEYQPTLNLPVDLHLEYYRWQYCAISCYTHNCITHQSTPDFIQKCDYIWRKVHQCALLTFTGNDPEIAPQTKQYSNIIADYLAKTRSALKAWVKENNNAIWNIYDKNSLTIADNKERAPLANNLLQLLGSKRFFEVLTRNAPAADAVRYVGDTINFEPPAADGKQRANKLNMSQLQKALKEAPPIGALLNDIQKNINAVEIPKSQKNNGEIYSIRDKNNVIQTDYLIKLGDKYQREQKELNKDYIIYIITGKTYNHIIDGLSNLVNTSTPIGEIPSHYAYSINLQQFAKLCGINHPSREQRAKIWRCLQILCKAWVKENNWFYCLCVFTGFSGESADAPNANFQLLVHKRLKADAHQLNLYTPVIASKHEAESRLRLILETKTHIKEQSLIDEVYSHTAAIQQLKAAENSCADADKIKKLRRRKQTNTPRWKADLKKYIEAAKADGIISDWNTYKNERGENIYTWNK